MNKGLFVACLTLILDLFLVACGEDTGAVSSSAGGFDEPASAMEDSESWAVITVALPRT